LYLRGEYEYEYEYLILAQYEYVLEYKYIRLATLVQSRVQASQSSHGDDMPISEQIRDFAYSGETKSQTETRLTLLISRNDIRRALATVEDYVKAAQNREENARKGCRDGMKSSVMRYERVYPANRGPDREVDGLMMTCPERLVVIVLVNHGIVHQRPLLQLISTCLPP
jgi:hypothetical protein